jgi:drug/metabolite transporter (DMT)-like permease
MKWILSIPHPGPSSQIGMAPTGRGGLLTIGIAILNQIVNVGATTSFAISGRCESFRDFLIWQIIGSAFGLGTQLTFAGLVRYASVQVASAIGIGFAFVSAEVFSAYLIFKEGFSGVQWLGVAFVFVGLMFIAWGRV